MGVAGQRPKPIELHKLQGTYKASRHAGAPIAEGELDRPPPHFDAALRKAWRYALDHAPRSLIKRIDRGVLAVWVEAEARHFEATSELRKINAAGGISYLIPGPMGGLVANPLVDVIDKAGKTMVRTAQELGFSPVARSRIRIEPDAGAAEDNPADNPWAALRVMPGGKA